MYDNVRDNVCAFDLSPSTLAVLYLPVPRVTVDNSETHFETHLETHLETHFETHLETGRGARGREGEYVNSTLASCMCVSIHVSAR